MIVGSSEREQVSLPSLREDPRDTTRSAGTASSRGAIVLQPEA